MNRIERSGKLYVAIKAKLGKGPAQLPELAEVTEIAKLHYPIEQLRQRVEHLIKQEVVAKSGKPPMYRLKEDKPAREKANGAFSVETSVKVTDGGRTWNLSRAKAHQLWMALNELFKEESQ